MPRDPDSVRSLFDRWAETYEDDLAMPTGPLKGYDESLRHFLNIVEVSRESDLLDVGIGTGALASIFADRGARVTGIDISEGMLAQCKAKHPDFRLNSGSFTNIPFADEEFDLVVSSFTFHEVMPATRSAACKEVGRVLRPGGQLALLDIIFPSTAALDGAHHAIGRSWDEDEDYPLISDLDTQLRSNGFSEILWTQSAPFHWIVVARKLARQP